MTKINIEEIIIDKTNTDNNIDEILDTDESNSDTDSDYSSIDESEYSIIVRIVSFKVSGI